jgi:hypothetical protein
MAGAYALSRLDGHDGHRFKQTPPAAPKRCWLSCSQAGSIVRSSAPRFRSEAGRILSWLWNGEKWPRSGLWGQFLRKRTNRELRLSSHRLLKNNDLPPVEMLVRRMHFL